MNISLSAHWITTIDQSARKHEQNRDNDAIDRRGLPDHSQVQTHGLLEKDHENHHSSSQ